MRVYPDTSLLVALYILGQHTAEVSRRMELLPEMLITPFHRCEFVHAVQGLVFRRSIRAEEARLVLEAFEQENERGPWVAAAFPEATFDTCISLAHRFTAKLGCRTLDALHVAAALELGAEEFWTFDERQKQLAAAVGLRAE